MGGEIYVEIGGAEEKERREREGGRVRERKRERERERERGRKREIVVFLSDLLRARGSEGSYVI